MDYLKGPPPLTLTTTTQQVTGPFQFQISILNPPVVLDNLTCFPETRYQIHLSSESSERLVDCIWVAGKFFHGYPLSQLPLAHSLCSLSGDFFGACVYNRASRRGCKEGGRLWPMGPFTGTVADVTILGRACWLWGVFLLSSPVFCIMVYSLMRELGTCV